MKTERTSEKVLGIEVDILKLFWLPLVLIGVGLMIGVLVIKPKIDEINNNQRQTQSLIKDNGEQTTRLQLLSAIDEDDLKTKNELLTAALPGGKDIYMLLTIISRISTKYNFVVDSFSVTPGEINNNSDEATNREMFSSIPLAVTLNGPKDKYLDFIANLEKSLPILEIGSFNMKVVGDAVNLELNIKTFYAKDKTTIQIEKVPLSELVISKEEVDLMSKLNSYEKVDLTELIQNGKSQKEFVKYDRTDPFNY